MEKEATLKAGDLCLDCHQLGVEKYLKLFKINLNGDTLLKCESNVCMFPYNDEMSSSDEEEQKNEELAEATFIEDFIQYCNNEDEVKTTNNDLQLNEQLTQFDITFLDDLNETESKNLCKPEIMVEKGEHVDNESKAYVVANNNSSLPTLNSLKSEIPITKEDINESRLDLTNDSKADSKRKIDIQSIETIKFETPLCNKDTLTTSQTCNTITDIPSKKSRSTKKSLKFSLTKSKSQFKSEKQPKSFVIPKADIIKGNALLKKLADVKETSPGVTKYKGARSKNPIKAEEIKKPEEPILSPSLSNSLHYSLEQISEMLTSKMKNDS